MSNRFLQKLILVAIFLFPLAASAHWIAGYVEDAIDSTSPNARTIRLWNPLNSQETFGIVGPSGLSGTSNVYMIDCEMLTTPCQVGDKLNLTVVSDGSGYDAKYPVSGAGFTMAPNLSLNAPVSVYNVTVEDSLTSPANEIDLTPANTTSVMCSAIAEDPEGSAAIQSAAAEMFSSASSAGSPDSNNDHYTNSSCLINESYGNSSQAQINCSFEIEYYARSGSWTCQINTTDNYSASTIESDTTSINTLLAIGVDSPMEFGEVDARSVSPEKEANVTNYGNVPINLTLNGYGNVTLDGNSMECGAQDIIIGYMKYNLTASNSSNLTLAQSEAIYENLTSAPTVKELNLNFRQSDVSNDAIHQTYWRVYVPEGVGTSCMGNIVFAATQS